MSSTKPQKYIYRLPYPELKELCHILDQNNRWEELGLKHMHYEQIDMDHVKTEMSGGKSPSNELLSMWGNQNHTVFELFILLNRMGLYQAMSVLRPFVDEKYHHHIKEDNAIGGLRRQRVQDSKIPGTNFDKNTVKSLVKKTSLESDENNETINPQAKISKTPTNFLVNHNNHHNMLNPPKAQVQKDSTKVLTDYVTVSAGATLQVSYHELELATDGWNVSNILGEGGFGTVFKGDWKCTKVAIKRLKSKDNTKQDFTEQIRQSITELHCLNSYRHDNILPLYGYSNDGPHPCLIYQYMPGGSLDGRIRPKDESKRLSWPTRLQIAIGTARGLQFLHTNLRGNKPMIHGDIKSPNILLDLMDQPKIGDFGLAREGPEGQYSHILVSRLNGTPLYLPNEFLRAKQSSIKVDTYSFGIVLFELATACRPIVGKQKLSEYVVNYPLENILKIKDSKVPGGEFIFKEFIRIGKICVEKRPRDRPEMVTVLLELEKVFTDDIENIGNR